METKIKEEQTATVTAEQDVCSRNQARQALEAHDLDQLLSGRTRNGEELIEVLQDIQEIHGYLPEELLRSVSEKLEVPLIEVFRIANFFKAFSLTPKGRHLITICNGTACHVRRSERLINELQSWLGVEPGETTEDGQFTVETVNCLGACALGPIVVIDGEYYDHVTPAKLSSLIHELPAG